MSMLSGNGSVVNVEEAVVEVTGSAATSIGGYHDILDHHLRGGVVHPRELIIVCLHPGARSIRTSQVIAVAADRRADAVGHPPSEDQSHDLPLYLHHHLDADAMKMMCHRDPAAAAATL